MALMLRKNVISRRFSASAPTYDCYSRLQDTVAERLCTLLPEVSPAHALEIGCGTGLFTKRLIRNYRNCHLTVTDLSEEMISLCRRKYRHLTNLAFAVMDGDRLALDFEFDLIGSSMCLQWLNDPVASLKFQTRLIKTTGSVVFAAIGPDNFPEWQESLASAGKSAGLLQTPILPGVIYEDRIKIDYGSAENFLAALKATGAHQPRDGYHPMNRHALKQVCLRFNRLYAGSITWHIVYGMLGKLR